MTRTLALTLAAVVATATVSRGQPSQESASEARETFAWLGGLGHPDVAGKPLVRFGWVTDFSAPEALTGGAVGFLVEEGEQRWAVLTLALDLVRVDAAAAPDARPAKEPLDLATYARERLTALTGDDERGIDRMRRRFGEAIAEPAELVVLAWGCARNGLEPLALELYAAAAAIPADRDAPSTLRARLAQQVAHASMWRNVLAFGDPSVPRAELLARFRAFVERFEGTQHHVRAAETVALLERMVAEDEAHRAPAPEAPVEAQVAHLVFQLRDQNGHQWSQPGSCDVFADPRGDESPAARLVTLGFDAVPQLIEALDDRRFTRSVGFHRNFYFSHHVLRVGDCAQAVLERIAGVSFYERTYTNAAMVKDGEAGGVKAAAQRWWAAVQAKGIDQVLVDAVASGDHDSPEQAARLLAKRPDLALEAIGRGVGGAKEEWVRAALVRVAGEHPEATAFLRAQLAGSAPLARVVAAEALHARGDPEALARMLEAWETAPLEAGAEDPFERLPAATGALMAFLLGCGRPEAVDALAARYGELPLDARFELVRSLGVGSFSAFALGGAGGGAGRPATSPAVDERVEALLARALTDTAARVGMSGTWGDVRFTDPRIGDVAAHVLAQRWPARYAFDLGASRAVREVARLGCLNAWRATRGLEPLPVPAPREAPAAPPGATRPALDALVAADDAGAIDRLEALGLGALPAVRARLTELPADHPARERLAALASRLSSVVLAVDVDADGAALPPAFRSGCEALVGARLQPEALVGLLCGFVREAGRGQRVLLTLERDERGVTIGLRGETTAARDGSVGTTQNVSAGGEGLAGLGGGGSRDHYATPAAYDDLQRGLSEALARPAEVPVSATVSLEVR